MVYDPQYFEADSKVVSNHKEALRSIVSEFEEQLGNQYQSEPMFRRPIERAVINKIDSGNISSLENINEQPSISH